MLTQLFALRFRKIIGFKPADISSREGEALSVFLEMPGGSMFT